MNAYIEPTAAEVKRAHVESGGEDLPWAEILDRGERLLARRLAGPDVDGYLQTSRDFTDLVALLCDEGGARGLPAVGRNRLLQAHYVAMRLDGCSHTLADMLVHRKPPMSNTDREFLEGHCNGNQFESMPAIGNWYKRQAEAAGQDVKGKVYINSLAAFPGDPQAWVSGRGDLEAVVRERDWSCQGSSNIKGERKGEGPADTRVADDLVESKMIDRLEGDPTLAFKGREALFEETREQIQPHWAA